jgi:hypothetical protein
MWEENVSSSVCAIGSRTLGLDALCSQDSHMMSARAIAVFT